MADYLAKGGSALEEGYTGYMYPTFKFWEFGLGRLSYDIFVTWCKWFWVK